MQTIFGSVLFHKMDIEVSEGDTDALLEELCAVLKKHGYELGSREFLGLPKSSFPIEECSRCRYLTLDGIENPSGIDYNGSESEGIHGLAARFVHVGKRDNGVMICNDCTQYLEGT